jgi:para-aminobenzoate synthetase / 4-amino-4-deoxychorismate lyase
VRATSRWVRRDPTRSLNVSASIRHAATGRWLEFAKPVAVLHASTNDEVADVVAAAEQAARGTRLHAVGFATYEAGPGFERKHVTHPPGRLPPAWFALFAKARTAISAASPPAPAASGLDWRSTISADTYRRQVAAIRRYIAAGDSYQVNLSYRLRAPLSAGPDAARQLFQAMIARQPGGYGARIETDEWALCCASHELFFARHGRRLTSRPMKGTAPRGRTTAEDAELLRWLGASLKNRAENLMITDMVRNDLGRLADVGSVRTDDLFRLEAYPTLWQMTSTVTAESDASLAAIFAALFPAASITGAPKRRTMEIIRELEVHPREIYTGAIGLVEPGGDAQFNVAIRTAWIDKLRHTAEYGVGGGIVWDSEPDEEYEETRTKARILAPATSASPMPPPGDFALLETLRWERAEGFFLLERHLDRLRLAAARFGRCFDEHGLREQLDQLARELPAGTWRVRLLVHADGRTAVTHTPLDRGMPAAVALADGPSPVIDNPFVTYKTTHRSLYDEARLAVRRRVPHADDVLLLNERGEVTESTIANLVVDVGGVLLTPPRLSGLLPGVYRQHLLDSGAVTECILRPGDVRSARAAYLVNSLRGMWRVTLL